MKLVRLSTLMWLEVALLLGWSFLIVVFEISFAVSLLREFCLFAAFVSALLLLPGFLSEHRQQALRIYAVFCVLLMGLRFVAISPVKPFMQFQASLVNGTSKSEVQQRFVSYFPPNGWFRQPVIDWGDGSPVTPYDNEPVLAGTPDQSIQYTLDPNDGAYNAEWLIVYLEKGRVVGTEYLGD
ncbi:hypothetical protein EON83_04990 [bacterium]|nr:MAG: hypothetical protein EON83_04990 [bacterium]